MNKSTGKIKITLKPFGDRTSKIVIEDIESLGSTINTIIEDEEGNCGYVSISSCKLFENLIKGFRDPNNPQRMKMKEMGIKTISPPPF